MLSHRAAPSKREFAMRIFASLTIMCTYDVSYVIWVVEVLLSVSDINAMSVVELIGKEMS